MNKIDQNHDFFAEKYLSAELGAVLPILENVFIIKADRHRYRYANMYVIVHPKERKLLLIDAIREEAVRTVKNWMANDYKISAIFLTHSDLLDQAYATIQEVSEELDDTAIFIHPDDRPDNGDTLFDITSALDILSDFNLKIFHAPGHTPGSVVIHSEMNGGILFAGDSAVGAPYEDEEYYFERPPNADTKDTRLLNFWKDVQIPFEHILPLHGRPKINMDKMQRESVLGNLRKMEKTESL